MDVRREQSKSLRRSRKSPPVKMDTQLLPTSSSSTEESHGVENQMDPNLTPQYETITIDSSRSHSPDENQMILPKQSLPSDESTKGDQAVPVSPLRQCARQPQMPNDSITQSSQSTPSTPAADDRKVDEEPAPTLRRSTRKPAIRAQVACTNPPTTASDSDQEDEKKENKKKQPSEKAEAERRKKEIKQAKTHFEQLVKNIERSRNYKEIDRQVKRYIKNDPYLKRAENKPIRGVFDKGIMQEVWDALENGETPEQWDARAHKEAKTRDKEMEEDDYPVDFVVGSEERPVGHKDFTIVNGAATTAFVKFSRYPVGSWEAASRIGETHREEYQQRLLYMDTIEVFERELRGDDEFKRMYPKRYLNWEKGRGYFGYVSSKDSIYRLKLRAIEYHWNVLNSRFGLPPVFIEDWICTKKKALAAALKRLTYVQHCIFSSEFRALLESKEKKVEHIKCLKNCGVCSSLKSQGCCRGHKRMRLDEDYVPHFVTSGKHVDYCGPRIECTDSCECTKEKCLNRDTQKGRQHPLVIFRDHRKEWTLRAVTPIMKNEFIAEYCGEVQMQPSKGRAQQYDYSLVYDVDDTTGPMFIAGYDKGNETIYMSHSCAPNVNCEAALVERFGVFYTHATFRADRNIRRGEELTFDYFKGRQLGDEDCDVSKMFKHGCFCESTACRFTKKAIDEWMENKKKEEEKDDKEEDVVQRRRSEKRRKAGSSSDSAPSTSSDCDRKNENGVKRRRDDDGEDDDSSSSTGSMDDE